LGLAGFEVRLPLSLEFGTSGKGISASTLIAACRLGLGFSTTRTEVVFASEAELSYRYSLNAAWAVQLGVSSKNWSFSDEAYDAGLSLILSTAYTW